MRFPGEGRGPVSKERLGRDVLENPCNRAPAFAGLTTRADLDAMAGHGVHAFLIGEALMRQDDVEAATRAMVA